jgi:hypothetical protein
VKASPVITSTNAGELGPALDGRMDLAKYSQGARLSENFLHLVQGPAQRRGGLRFVEEVKDSDDRCWLVEFEFSATQAFTLEFGDEYVRFYTNRGRLLVSGVDAYDAGTDYVVGDLVLVAGSGGSYDEDAFDEGAFDPDAYDFDSAGGDVYYYCIADTTGNAPPNATYWYALTEDIYEIPSPYTAAQLTNTDGTCSLRIVQSGDVLYIAHSSRTIAPMKLTRYANTNWQFSTYRPNQGPFLSLNQDTAITVYASAASGSVTLQASADIFAATDVGRLFRLEVEDHASEPWETNKSYALNDLVRSDGKTYKCTDAGTSGTATPIHDHGRAWDGKAAVQWEYQDPGYGIARITAYTDANTVTATVITDRDNGLNVMPFDVIGSGKATDRWQLGAWSDTTGYPSAVTFFKNRLWWATRQSLHGSVPNDFENMAEDFFNEVRDDSAINYQVNAQDINEILWIEGGEKLIVGTGGGEFVGGEQNPNNPLSPFNFQCPPQSRRRVRGVAPVGVGTSLLYVQRAGRKLLSMDYAIERDRYVSSDQTVLNDRITRSGIVWMCYQGEPDSMLWCGLANGKLVGFTLDQEQQVAGWGRHPIGGDGLVESGVSTPSPNGLREDLWVIVRRTINGQTKRYVEYMEKPWEGNDIDGSLGEDQEDAFYVDSGLSYNGVSTRTVTGLEHLEGCTVQVLADGAVVSPDPVVSGGSITIARAAVTWQIGFQYVSRWVSNRIEVPTNDGTSQGKIKRLQGAAVRFIDTLGGECGQFGGTLESLSYRSVSTSMGHGEPIRFTGTHDAVFGAEYDVDAMLEIRQAQPLPMTITSIAPRLGVHGSP